MGIRCAEDKSLLSLCKRPTLRDTFEIIESACGFQFKWLSMLIPSKLMDEDCWI